MEESHRLSPQALERLVGSRQQFLSFLQRRVGSEAAAEDILQTAFVRGMEKGGAVRDDESVVAWFYRLLRNAVIDSYRQRASTDRALQQFGHEIETRAEPEDAFRAEICGCLNRLLEGLKPEYRDALRIVDLEERSLAELARQTGISANNAAVRVHRARQALRKEVTVACGVCATHGCVECHCQPGSSASAPRV
jgi:RNA polymerase sigma-70 factor (ECF subfamily)